MNTSSIKPGIRFNRKTAIISKLALALALASFTGTAQAGKITSIATPDRGVIQDGFGGWNLENIEVHINGASSTFNESTGAYSFSVDSDLTYSAHVFDDDSGTTLMGYVLAKDWPVGEPAGIKIVNDDLKVKEGKPTNCIMSTSYLEDHFLDDSDPQPVPCSGPFQSHKRYKLAMLPTTVDGGNESIDLVFNVEVEADPASRDYQVFQKINNWTDARLKGFTIQVGTGIGANFVPASDATAGAGVANLSLSVPAAVWEANQLANFSIGLFGPASTHQGISLPPGYFDPDTRAGFTIVEYPNLSGQTDILQSGATLGSDYAAVPPATGAGAYQFGNWLPNSMLPYGIFYDDDGNPDTDAELKAWYGDRGLNDFGWMTGVADGFTAVPDTDITNWSSDPLYSMGAIDDLVNVGLNYIVTVGDVSAFPDSRFTIRITPIIDDSGMPEPAFVGQIPDPALVFASSDAIIQLDPSPEFMPGSLLTVRVGDADLNQAPDAIDITTVGVSTDDGITAPVMLTLEELGANRGVFAANLPGDFSNVAAGTTVTVTYTDAVGGTTEPEDITASSTAVAAPAGTIQFNPVNYTVVESDGSVVLTVERINGSAGEATVDYDMVAVTATAGDDYVTASDTLTFPDGVTSQTITVSVLNDSVEETDEDFTVELSNVQGATAGAEHTATVTITDSTATETFGSDGSNGCSCAYSPDGSIDPLLPGLLLASLIYFGWRDRKDDNVS